MSAAYVCASCRATYLDVQADGAIYFHRCPPVYDGVSNSWTLPPTARDENIVMRGDGTVAGIKADGLGVKLLSTGKDATPAWQQKVAAKVAREDV